MRLLRYALLLCLGCSSDESRDDASTAMDAATETPSMDAAPPEVPDTGVDAAVDAGRVEPDDDDAGAAADASSDSGSSTSPETHCRSGKMACGEDCIDPIEATATSIHERVLALSCALSSSCHSGNTPKEGLDLETLDDVFTTAVGQPSSQMPSLAIIEPGDSSKSYLINKLRDMNIAEKGSTGVASTPMPPPPNPSLCEEKIEIIEAWIREGAKRD